MIFLDAKAEAHKSDAPNFSSLLSSDVDEKGKPKQSFLELLKGVESSDVDDLIKFIPLEEKVSLKGANVKDIDLKETKLPLKTLNIELNPLLTKDISPKDLKALVIDAKKFLKTKILQNSDFKIHEAKELPKTLKGLVDIANKLGLDIKQITLEDVQPLKYKKIVEVKQVLTKETKQEVKANPKTSSLDIKSDAIQNIKAEIKTPAIDIKSDAIQNIKAEIKTPAIDIKSDTKQNVKPEINTNSVEIKTDSKHEIRENPKTSSLDIKPEVKAPQIATKLDTKEIKQEAAKSAKEDVKQDVKQDVKSEPKSSLPLFKELLTLPQKVLTQHIVDVKQNLISKGTNKDSSISSPALRKQKADETLKLLLRGDKPKQASNAILTADFSVASARVIAPSATSEISRSLESLLQNKTSTSSNINQDADDNVMDADAIKTHKTDNFVLKLNEAKQMVKYLSQDVKTAIDDYKSPFSRIKVQLNPQNLGEVDLTIVSRGKNLHVNISANNVAINALAMNVNDLRAQLNNNGINNATLNFNSGSNSEQQSQNSDQNHRNQQEASEEYNYFEADEQNEEVLSSLEIVVPSYA